jgi:hypothetical protein
MHRKNLVREDCPLRNSLRGISLGQVRMSEYATEQYHADGCKD